MHIPVLKEEVLQFLKPEKDQNFIDCTAGEGGHVEAILEKNGPKGKVLAIEWDEEIYALLKEKENENKRIVAVNDSYTLIDEIVKEKNFFPVSGILFDLGFCSFHIDESKRGFSFMRDEFLDMRYNKNNPLTAYEIVNKYKEKDIAYILKKWGEEEFAEDIAKKIVLLREKKPIKTTKDLAEIIRSSLSKKSVKKKRIDDVTKTFQAIRIAVNGEILGFKAALPRALEVLERGGKMVVICFHGGEEKVLLDFFRKAKVKLITPKPIIPNKKEINKNIRARSAKLYAAVKK